MKDKTVLITGASGGIGRAVALAFARKGANVALNYNSRKPEETLSEISAMGVRCEAFQADVSSFSQAKELIRQVKESFGRLDVLVNNAGITKDQLIIRMSEEEFDKVIEVNLKGVFNTTKHAANLMLKQRSGSIINMSSIVGVYGNTGQGNYAAAKAGIIGFTKAMAKELAPRSVTCNAIAPGFIETEMTQVLSEEYKEKAIQNIGLKRFGKPEEVADLAVFLAESKYITGQVVQIDGGLIL